jgi:integrase
MQRHVAWIHPDQAKAGKAIGIPLNNEAIEVLKNQIGKHSIRVFIFNGQPVKKAGTRAFKNALSKAGIENFRWHDLRHTWASWHVQNGTPLHVLKELGGWASYEMVQRYAHLAPEHLVKYASNSGQFVAKSVALDNLSKLKKL